MKLMRRKPLVAGAAAVVLIGTVAGLVMASGPASGQRAGNSTLPPATATIARTTLVETRTVAGTLDYGARVPVRATGTLTWAVPAGSTVERGQPLFDIDGRPVPLLYGTEPLYRPLSVAADDITLATLRREVARKEVALGNALDTLADAEKAAAEAAVGSGATSAAQARDEYRNVFARWLGIALTEAELGRPPADILAESGIDLNALFTRPPGQRPTGLPSNEPDTPWNELVVATWLYLYPSPIYATCPDDFDIQDPSKGRCVMAEMEAAWAGLAVADRGLVRAQRALALAEAEVAVAVSELEAARAELEAARNAQDTAVVRQLQENLAELGHTGFDVNGIYDAATAAAVRAWQTDLGLPVTGTVAPGQVVFAPGPVRVNEHMARVGDAVRDAPVLSYTSTERVVTVPIRAADQYLAVVGSEVTATLPDRRTVKGVVASLGTAVTNGNIEVTVTIPDQEAIGPLTAASVDVEFVSRAREDVLVVPVAALLALAEGGYGVEVVEGDTSRIVAVRTGMFAGGRVEISGEGIAEGMRVGVPR